MALKSRHGAAAPDPACGHHRPPEGNLPSDPPLQFPLETARGPAPDPGNGPHRAVGDASPCPLFVVLADDPGACAPDPASGPIGPPEGIPRTPPTQPSRTASLGPFGGRLGDARALPQNGAYAPRCVQLTFYTAGRFRIPLFTNHLHSKRKFLTQRILRKYICKQSRVQFSQTKVLRFFPKKSTCGKVAHRSEQKQLCRDTTDRPT